MTQTIWYGLDGHAMCESRDGGYLVTGFLRGKVRQAFAPTMAAGRAWWRVECRRYVGGK